MANTSVIGIYGTYDELSAAVDALRIAGFRNTDISALLPANEGTKDFAHEKNTKAPEGTTHHACGLGHAAFGFLNAAMTLSAVRSTLKANRNNATISLKSPTHTCS